MLRLSLSPLIALLMTTTALAAAETTVLVDDKETLVRGAGIDLTIGIASWGPKWSRLSLGGDMQTTDGAAVGTFSGSYTGAGSSSDLTIQVAQSAPQELTYQYALTAEADQDYTMIAVTVDPGRKWKGSVQATDASGAITSKEWPIGRDGLGDNVTSVIFESQAGTMTFRFDPAVSIAYDRGELRIPIARELQGGTTRELVMSVGFSHEVDFYPSIAAVPEAPGKARWFTWQPEHDYQGESAFSMADWSDGPAGTHGRVDRIGGKLVYGGEPLWIWGLNICFGSCAPDQELADRRADFYAKYGINSVRLHKYAQGGLLKDGSSTEWDPEALDQMDYFVAALKKRGIFVKLSPTFGSMKIAADAFDRIPYADSWGKKPEGRKRIETGGGAVFLSPELQQMHFEQMANLLNHTNPYTGLTYAEDPAIMLVEAVNEESALFFGTLKQMQNVPALAERTGKLFHDWLIERYGDQQAVIDRWGGEELIGTFRAEKMHQESFANGVIYPVGNPWFWDPENITGSQKSRAPRLYDAALFLYELQNDFYDRYEAAVRETGYEGLFMASNWQAGAASSHYYNLHTDARFDVVDRHNYFGGKNVSGSMLSAPGGGSLSSGMQQVLGVPFSLSEWIHVFPNQWGAEGPAIIGAYGMGLQGWDISYMFQNRDQGRFSDELSPGRWDIWDVTAPQVMGTFPAVARQVRRGDVAEGDELALLNVHIGSLHRGEIDFQDVNELLYDIKVYGTDKVPAATLAVARTAVDYVDEPTPTDAFDLEAHRDEAGALVSTTGQLRWMPGDDGESGWFSMDTAGTQAVVGFAQGTRHELADVVIAPQSRYGLIYLTAASKDGTIAADDTLLIVASARAHNSGMKYLDGQLIAKGDKPVVMEPVMADITLKRPGATVHVCDHDGRRTGETIPVDNGSFTIDGRATGTIYYEVTY